MYLAETINKILDSKKDRIIGRPSYQYIIGVLNRSFKKEVSFKFKYELYGDYNRNDFSVSGIYDMSRNQKYIIINFPKKYQNIFFNESRWKDFRFAVSQVCQHELIHEHQWMHREQLDWDRMPLEFRCEDISKAEERDYLNDADEIEAYAHDIAMEIKYFYPSKDPYKVLQNVHRYKKIWSYRYYSKTFRGTEWSGIHNKLLKKTYQWMPHVIV